MFTHDLGVKRQRRLRHRRHTEGLSRQHEACDIAAAVDRAVNSKRLVGMDDRDMRCAKEVEILQRLFGVSCLVSPDDAERVVELETAFAPPLQIPFLTLITLALFVVQAWAFIDAVSRRPEVFVAADKLTKPAWLMILGLALVAHMLIWNPISLLNLVGTVAAIVYIVDARPVMRSLTRR